MSNGNRTDKAGMSNGNRTYMLAFSDIMSNGSKF